VRLRETTLSYAVPASLARHAGLHGLSLYVTGRNLWISTKFSMGDPEGNTIGPDNPAGVAYHFFSVPTTRSWTFGLRTGI
jgi:hypothetical protein